MYERNRLSLKLEILSLEKELMKWWEDGRASQNKNCHDGHVERVT